MDSDSTIDQPLGGKIIRPCARVLLRKPLVMFGLPALAYAICQVLGIVCGVASPGSPTVIGQQQTSPGEGGPVPWLLWLILCGLATSVIVGIQVLVAGRLLAADNQLLSGQLFRSTGRAAASFLGLMLVFSLGILAIYSAPGYVLYIMTTYPGSDFEDMRISGLFLLTPVCLAGLVATPVIGQRFVLAVPVSVFENTNPYRSLSRSLALAKRVDIFGPFAILGLAMVIFATALIVLSSIIPVAFPLKFGIGGWLFLVLFEPVHVALAVLLFRKARRREC